MMDFGFGYMGSSSNLSPLAPPFTLDRTFPRPNTENFVNVTDLPPTEPFSSSSPSWQYSPSVSNPNLYSNSSVDMGVDSTRPMYFSSENYYPYFGVPSISSPCTQMPSLNADVSDTPNAFAFSQFSSEIPTSQVESKTYCPSFVSPVVEDDDPLVVLQKPSYSLSSTSHITPLGGSSQVDYHQSLSGLEYKPQWGNYRDRIDKLADCEMGKQVEYDGSFCSTKTDGVASFAYQTYPKQGASIAEGFNMGKEASAVLNRTCLNLLGGESQTVTPTTGEMDYKPLSSQLSPFTPYNFARTSGVSTPPKSHAYVPPVEAAPTILNHQNPFATQNQSFQMFNAGKNGSVTIKKPSPPLVIRPPSVGSNPRLEKKDHFSDSNSSNIKRELPLPIKPMAEKVEGNLSTGIALQLPAMNAPSYSFNSASDKAKSTSSVEGPLESIDRNYPALDSPCWKGSSSFRFSPAEDREAVTPEHLVEKPESQDGLKLQQCHFITPFEDNVKSSGQKVHENSVYQENGYVELGSLLCPVGLPNVSSPMKADSGTHEGEIDNSKMSSTRVDPFSDNIDTLTKKFCTTNHLNICTGLRLSQLKHLDSEKDLELGFGVAEARLNCSDASSKGKVQKLVDTIHNLSEVLLLQCSEDTSALLEMDHGALKLAMENLDACVSKAVPKQTQESDPHKGVISGRPQMTKEASSSLEYNNHRSPQGTKNNELSEMEVKKLTDLFSTRVNEDFVKNDKVTQAIKKVFEENFSADKERQPETLLYKNLWLEAEAALCSVSFRARYDRMKNEMDKSKSPKTEVAEPAKTFEELYSEVFPDPSSPQQGNPLIEAIKILNKSSQDPSASKPTKTVDEVDASFRARLHILNNREPSRNSESEGDLTDEEADAAFAETIKTVEKLLSSEDADDCVMTNLTQKGPPHAIGSTKDDNVEARVMARFQLLKNRDFNKVYESGQQSGQVVSSEFSGETNPWRFNVALYDDDVVDGSLSQICKVSEHKQDQHCGAAGVKDFHASATDFQLYGNERMVTQPASGWCDNSLSDWEDVLKDDHCR